jgi:hypothetical protein
MIDTSGYFEHVKFLCLSRVFAVCFQEFDGSDSGASPDEAVSWGKIKMTSTPVKISVDATLVFPLIVSQTFYKEWEKRQRGEQTKLEEVV